MTEIIERLFKLADELDDRCKQWSAATFAPLLQRLKDAAEEIGDSWSDSWLGYHSRVYYSGFQKPPPGAHFSRAYGFREAHGDWEELSFETVTEAIRSKAKVTTRHIEPAAKEADELEELFHQSKNDLLSAITIALQVREDSYLTTIKAEAEKLKLFSASDCARTLQPAGKFTTYDTVAAHQGYQVPPHISIIAHVFEIQQPVKGCETLAKLSRRAASHLNSSRRQDAHERRLGTKVFIGHGRSPIWKDLKDFIQDRLKLPWDEFNRVPVAGITNIARLSQMLDDAAIAFLVLTAEDQQLDGTVRARMNVIHEAGLFQGRLGFTKAIVILEESCEEFTNIQGLGQIRFPENRIKAAFEEVRHVLEREQIITL